MHKGSLIDILFERTQTNDKKIRELQQHNQNKHKQQKHTYTPTPRKQYRSNQSNKIIKITQFNSSLFMGEDKLMHSGNYSSYSASPKKKFNIKKINQFKNNLMMNAQKTIEVQLKKKEQDFNIKLKPSSAKSNFAEKQLIDNPLIATKCSANRNFPSFDDLMTNFNLDQVFCKEYDSKYALYLDQFKAASFIEETGLSKDCLSQTNESLKESQKESSCKQESPSKLNAEEGSNPLEEIPSPSPPKRAQSPRKVHSRMIMQQKKFQENLQKQKRQMLQLKKQLNKNYSKPYSPPENISAQAYIIYETDIKKMQYNPKAGSKRQELHQNFEQKKMLLHSHQAIASLNPRIPLEIASLTKIMTCVVALDIAKKYEIQLGSQQVTIGAFEQNIGGTSANIKKGQIYTVEQLLYGLMLPSGNDASLALAAWGGKKLLQHQCPKKQGETSSFLKRQAYARFIAEMNTKACELYMQKTKYSNSHGLANIDNKSCVFDLAILCEHAMNNPKFREIVSSKVFECEVKIEGQPNQEKPNSSEQSALDSKIKMMKKSSIFDPQQGLMQLEEMKDTEEINENYNSEEQMIEGKQAQQCTKQVRWQNSHLLLQSKSELYVGIKTGVTVSAGPCLASCVQFKGRRFLFIVLNCKSMKLRFKDTENLRKWLFNKEGFEFSLKGSSD